MNIARMEIEKGFDRVLLRLPDIVDTAVNPTVWTYEYMKEDLFDNQIEVLNAICDLRVKNVAILQSRGGGKSYVTGIGLTRLCSMHRGLKVGVFGPKAEQAERILKEIRTNIVKPGTLLYDKIDWEQTIKSRVVFHNGSEILAISADESSMQEGWHFHIAVLDECHRISDISVNQRITPMLGSYKIAKMIKIGISMYRNNFWKSCVQQKNYKVLRRTWLECPILLRSGSFMYKHPAEAVAHEYPEYIVDRLSLKVKQLLFPDRPDLHFDGEITELDYKTQYNMEWASDINLFLDEEDQQTLVTSDYEILTSGRPEYQEEYFFGLDTAPGTLMPGKKDLDYTHLAIWRKRPDNVLEKVACYEWQGEIVDQIEEIREIIHPVTGVFRCRFGLADYSNIAQSAVAYFQKERIPIDGIMFKQTETTSKKNYKNAMFDQFKFELQSGRVKYPAMHVMDAQTTKDERLLRQQILMKKSFNEWCRIEQHMMLGLNNRIEAPSGFHDDGPCSDVLAVWAILRHTQFKGAMGRAYKLPSLQINAVVPIQGRMGKTQESRYLK